jgi:hypothetical protein
VRRGSDLLHHAWARVTTGYPGLPMELDARDRDLVALYSRMLPISQVTPGRGRMVGTVPSGESGIRHPPSQPAPVDATPERRGSSKTRRGEAAWTSWNRRSSGLRGMPRPAESPGCPRGSGRRRAAAAPPGRTGPLARPTQARIVRAARQGADAIGRHTGFPCSESRVSFSIPMLSVR